MEQIKTSTAAATTTMTTELAATTAATGTKTKLVTHLHQQRTDY